MGKILSEKITVFPSARRANRYPESRQMSEQAFTAIVNRFVEFDSFLIECGYLTDGYVDPSKPISFNIHGYYFRVNEASYLWADSGSSSEKDLYINIETITTGKYIEIWGQDTSDDVSTSEYQGLVITYGAPLPEPQHEGNTVYSFKALTRDEGTGNAWKPAENATFRFTAKTVKFEIDGGTFGE